MDTVKTEHDMNNINNFWKEIKIRTDNRNNPFFTKPEVCYKEQHIYKIQTREDYIFDDDFWDIFHKYPFHICHITFGNRYILLPKITEIKYGRFFFELRFRIKE